MSEFNSILRVALKDDTIFDGLLRLAQEQGCSIRAFLKGIALNGHPDGEGAIKLNIVKEPACDESTVDVQSETPPTMEEICNKFFDDVKKDPKALGRYMAERRRVCGDIEFTSEEARELWEDC